MSIVDIEREAVGFSGFYFAGLPAWLISSCLTPCRFYPLERLISFLQRPWLQWFPNGLTSLAIRSVFFILHSGYV